MTETREIGQHLQNRSTCYTCRTTMSCVLCFFLVFLLGNSHGFTVDMETDLRQHLLLAYSPSVRPDSVTLVQLSINLLSINQVDLKGEKFSLTGWWSLKWTDSRLAWMNTNYTVPVIQVYQSEIWTPALVVDNSVNDLSAIDESSIPIRVAMDGQVTWNPPGILLTSCEMDVTYFPFDIQTCAVQVTSFGYTIQELNVSVHSSGVNDKYYSENGEWNLIKTWNQRSEFVEEGYQYAKVTLYFQLQRRATYYGLNTILPVLLDSLMIPLVFLLPHDSGEKVGYCLKVLLAYVVILTIVTDGLPTTAKNQSLLGLYIAMVLMLSGMSVALTIHSLHIYHRSPSIPVPRWQERLTRFVLALLGKTNSIVCSNKVQAQEQKHSESAQDPHKANASVLEHVKPSSCQNIATTAGSQGPCTDRVHLTSVETDDDGMMTWKMVAQTYDNVLLRLYFCFILLLSIGFLFAIVSTRF